MAAGSGRRPRTAPGPCFTSPYRGTAKTNPMRESRDSDPIIAIVDDDLSAGEGLQTLLCTHAGRGGALPTAPVNTAGLLDEVERQATMGVPRSRYSPSTCAGRAMRSIASPARSSPRAWRTRRRQARRSARRAGKCPTSSRTKRPGDSTGRRSAPTSRFAILGSRGPRLASATATCGGPRNVGGNGPARGFLPHAGRARHAARFIAGESTGVAGCRYPDALGGP